MKNNKYISWWPCRCVQVAATLIVMALTNASNATTYYKVGTDGSGTSSFAGNVSSTVGWSTTQGASSTSTISDFASSDFIINNLFMRTPASNSAASFTGKSLTLTNSGGIYFKRASNGGTSYVTIPNLCVSGNGILQIAQDKSLFHLCGALALEANATVALNYTLASGAGDYRHLTIDADLTGDDTTTIHIYGSGNASNNSALTLASAEGFYGTVTAENNAYNFALTVSGPFNGTITSLPSATTNIVFNYDGLPSDTGLRIATTTIPEVIKTKLNFYSPTADFGSSETKLVTFPEGTEVNADEFSIKYSKEMGGDLHSIKLAVVTNSDNTVSLVCTGGYTFYKIGTDAGGTSSFYTNYSASVGWATDASASATTPFSAEDMAISNFIIPGGNLLRTPVSAASSYFNGLSLQLGDTGTEATVHNLMLKNSSGATITIPNLISYGGRVFAGDSGYTYNLEGRITIVSGSSFNVCGADTGTRTIKVNSAIYGDDTTTLNIYNNNTGNHVMHFNDAENFYGTFTDSSSSCGSCTIYFNGRFNGSIGSLTSKSTLIVNYDGLPSDKGLVVSTTSIPSALKTKLTFFAEDTSKFTATNLLPLITFPEGTAVDVSEFTAIKYATSASSTGTVISDLTTYEAEDGSVVLAVDCKVPRMARMENDGGTYSWHFYSADGTDLTSTCGLTVPTSDITVYITSQEEIAAIRENKGTPAAYVVDELELSSDEDFFDLYPISLEGGTIDLNGYTLCVTGALFSASSGGTITNSVDNGVLRVNVPTNTTISNTSVALGGSLKLVKEGAGTFVGALAQTYTGGTLVAEGTAQPPDGNGADTTYCRDIFKAFGTGSVIVSEGATFDLRANYAHYGYTSLDGGTLTNTKADMTKTSWGGSGIGALTKDSTLNVPYSIVYETGTTDLGGNTLNVSIASAKYLYLRGAPFTNGTVNITSGGYLQNLYDCDAKTVDFKVNCALVLNKNLSVHDYYAMYGDDANSGTAALNVYGTFKPVETGYCTNTIMQVGTTLDLTDWKGTWPLAAATAGEGDISGVSFAEGTADEPSEVLVVVDFARQDIRDLAKEGWTGGGYLLKWSAKPANVEFVLDQDENPSGCKLQAKDDGLVLFNRPGTVIYVR